VVGESVKIATLEAENRRLTEQHAEEKKNQKMEKQKLLDKLASEEQGLFKEHQNARSRCENTSWRATNLLELAYQNTELESVINTFGGKNPAIWQVFC
jgi:hypothetical protein